MALAVAFECCEHHRRGNTCAHLHNAGGFYCPKNRVENPGLDWPEAVPELAMGRSFIGLEAIRLSSRLRDDRTEVCELSLEVPLEPGQLGCASPDVPALRQSMAIGEAAVEMDGQNM
jgi:hypothetical protein